MDGVKCPHCGYLHETGEHAADLPWDDNADPEFECSRCEETFWIRTDVRISWTVCATEEEWEYA